MLSKAVVSTPAGERLYVTLYGEHGVHVLRLDAVTAAVGVGFGCGCAGVGGAGRLDARLTGGRVEA